MKEIYRKTDAIEFEGDPISYVVYQLENGFYQVVHYCGTEDNARSKFRIEEAVDWENNLTFSMPKSECYMELSKVKYS